MANTINLNKYSITGDEKILMDANILLYLFGPYNDSDDKGYSIFLEDALSKGTQLYVNECVLSEFVNRNCRLAYEQFLINNDQQRKTYGYKTKYRKTEEFKKQYQFSINLIKEDILSIANFSPTSDAELNKVISFYSMLDFNDEFIIRNAEFNGYSVVTHDRDFFSHEANVNVFHY